MDQVGQGRAGSPSQRCHYISTYGMESYDCIWLACIIVPCFYFHVRFAHEVALSKQHLIAAGWQREWSGVADGDIDSGEAEKHGRSMRE